MNPWLIFATVDGAAIALLAWWSIRAQERVDERYYAERAAAAAPLPTRQVPVQRPTGPLPLPRGLRKQRALPAHVDPPLSPLDQAETARAWPHLVSSYYQEDYTP